MRIRQSNHEPISDAAYPVGGTAIAFVTLLLLI